MVNKKTALTLSLRSDLVEWLQKEYPKRIGEFLEPLIEKQKASDELEDGQQRQRMGIPPGLKRFNGFVEYAPGKYCEEKDYWRIDSILKEIKDRKSWPSQASKRPNDY